MMKRAKGRLVNPTVCLLAAGTILSLSTAAPSAAQKTRSLAGTLTIRLSTSPPNLDPAIYGQEDNPLMMMRFVYDSLVVNQDGTIKPYLATRWKQTGTSEVKFWMRRGVTCADGSRLRASDVANTIAYFVNPATASRALTFVFGQPTVNVQASNFAGTVTIHYPKPNPDALFEIARLPIICSAGLKDPALLKTQTFGTGPFVLTEAVPGDHYTLTKRKGYTWGPNGDTTAVAGFPDKVVLRVIENETTAANAFLAGQIDVMFARGLEQGRLMQSAKSFKLVSPVQMNLMMINQTGTHAGADLNVRKGLVASMNRRNLVRVILGASGRPSNLLLLPDSPCQDPTAAKLVPASDPAAAARFFQTAGYQMQGGKLMKDGKQLTLKAQIIDSYAPAADYLVTVWGQVGIAVNAVVAPASQVIATITGNSGDWDIAFSTFSTHFPSYLHTFLQGPPRPAGFNFMGITNAAYNSLSARALAEQDPTKVCGIWAPALRAVISDQDFVPIAYADTDWFGNNVKFKATSSMFGIFPSSLSITK
jgi:peptide/nickel transport system substrate-binding protein